MRLYFDSSDGARRLVGSAASQDEAIALIERFCNARNFAIYYIRFYGDEHSPHGKTFDVGSYTEFFRLISSECDSCAYNDGDECELQNCMYDGEPYNTKGENDS